MEKDSKPTSTIVIDEKQLRVIRADISPVLARAQGVTISNQEDLKNVKAMILEDRAIRERGIALIEKPKKMAGELHKWFCSIEKELTEPIDQARKVYDSKIKGYLDEQDRIAEENRRKEEERLAKEREKTLARLQGQMSKLTDGITDKTEQIQRLETLKTPEMSFEETQAIDNQIAVIQRQIQQKTEKIEDITLKTEEVSQPQIPSSTYFPTATENAPKGVSANKKKVGTVVSPINLIKAIAAGTVPVGVVKEFDMKLINTLLNSGMDLPGVMWEWDRSIKVRGSK